MVGPQPARYRLAVGSGQKSGRVGLRFYDPSAPLTGCNERLGHPGNGRGFKYSPGKKALKKDEFNFLQA